jgi:hypothetical protein
MQTDLDGDHSQLADHDTGRMHGFKAVTKTDVTGKCVFAEEVGPFC